LGHAIRPFLSKGHDIKQTGGATINGRPLGIGKIAWRRKKPKKKKKNLLQECFLKILIDRMIVRVIE